VWATRGSAAEIEHRLREEDVRIVSVQEQSAIRSALSRQGPALANVLFIAEAGAVALLAAGGTALSIYLTSRRRRYEFAALEATGLPRQTLLYALLMEQSIILGFGSIVGVGTGLAAVGVVIRNVPEFIETPAAPALSYTPSGAQMVLGLAIVLVPAVVAMVLSSVGLVGGVRFEQLRESPE
jgi:ABC-type antimicrobial peptide transport system permease subunit